MKVYVVETDVYEQRGIAGIYSSLEAAQRAHPVPDPTPSRRRDGGWQLESPGYWYNGSTEIFEWEVEDE